MDLDKIVIVERTVENLEHLDNDDNEPPLRVLCESIDDNAHAHMKMYLNKTLK